MRCIKCRQPAHVEVRRHRSAFCAGCYPGWFRTQVQRTIDDDRMFSREDSILVAVSGGKDSLALWHTMLELGYQADGMYIRLGIADYSRRSQAKCEAFAEKHGQTDFLGRQGPVLESTHPKLVRKVKPLYKLAERDTAAYSVIERIDYILEECPMAKGAKSLFYKDTLNALEEAQPGAKQRFLM